MTDPEALHLYAHQRDADAFRLLVEHHQTLVYSAARRRLAHSHDIEDAVQITFFKLAKAAATLRRDGSGLALWLYTTALNTANELIRKDLTRRRHESSPSVAEAIQHRAAATTPSIDLEHQEFHNLTLLIDQALLQLPPEQQSLIIEHYFQNRTQTDLARSLRTSQPTIARRLKDAVSALRHHLATLGHATPALALPTALQQIAAPTTPIPAHLTATLTKIGLASLPAAAVTSSFMSSLSTAKLLAGSALLITIILVVPFATSHLGASSPPTPVSAPATSIATTLPASTNLAPTDLDFSRVTVNLDNLAGPAAAQSFAEQAAFPIRLFNNPPPPPISLHVLSVPFLEALFQFADRSNGRLLPTELSSTRALITPSDSLTPTAWTVSGPLAMYVQGFQNALQLQFVVDPHNTQYLTFPDTITVDKFIDDRNQPILLDPLRPTSPPMPRAFSSSLRIPILLPRNPGKRVAVLKGSAIFKLVSRTQVLSTAAPADHPTHPVGDATIEILPLDSPRITAGTSPQQYECQVLFHRGTMAVDAWPTFVKSLHQSRVTFIDTSGQSFPSLIASWRFTPREPDTLFLAYTTAGTDKPLKPRSIRIEIPTDSRRVLFPFEFKDLPLPGTPPATRNGN